MIKLQENKEWFVTVFDSTNIHVATRVREVRGIFSLKKGEAFDFSTINFWDNAVPRYQVVNSYYVDDPEDELGCIDAIQTYNPEI